MLNIPYTDIIHTKTLMDEYKLVDKNKSIVRSIICKYYKFTVNRFIKKLYRNLTDSIEITKPDIIHFCTFLECIENNNRKDKLCIVKSPYSRTDSYTRYQLQFDNYTIDTMQSNKATFDVFYNDITQTEVYKIHGELAFTIGSIILQSICHYLNR